MKISCNVWHYRLADRFFGVPRKVSLCRYFWTVVLALIAHALVGVVLAGAAFSTFYAVVAFFGFWWYLFYYSVGELPINVVFMAVIDMVACLFLGVWAIDRRNPGSVGNVVASAAASATDYVGESLLVRYIKAVKSKACPIMEVDFDS